VEAGSNGQHLIGRILIGRILIGRIPIGRGRLAASHRGLSLKDPLGMAHHSSRTTTPSLGVRVAILNR